MNQDLAKFLKAKKRPAGTRNYPNLNGFLFSMACSPERIAADVWLPMVFSHSDPKFKHKEEQEKIQHALVLEYEDLENRINNNDKILAPYFEPSAEVMENFDEDSPIAHWGRGVQDGFDVLSPVWEAYVPIEHRKHVNTFISTLTFFADIKQAKQACELQDVDNLTREVFAETVIDNFEAAAMGYAEFGLGIRKTHEQDQENTASGS